MVDCVFSGRQDLDQIAEVEADPVPALVAEDLGHDLESLDQGRVPENPGRYHGPGNQHPNQDQGVEAGAKVEVLVARVGPRASLGQGQKVLNNLQSHGHDPNLVQSHPSMVYKRRKRLMIKFD